MIVNNCQVIIVYNKPIIALDEFKSEFYDLITLDIQMPDINGFQFFREIKKRDVIRIVNDVLNS
jgi:DNA-binding response OmpR family regulator